MPRCIKCGNVYSSKYVSGFCDTCQGAAAVRLAAKAPPREKAAKAAPTMPVPPPHTSQRTDSSGSEISLGKYEEEVAKASRRAPPPSKPRRNRRFHLITVLIFLVIMLGGVVLSYIGFGPTKHFGLWAVALVFFFVGSAMIVTKRLIVARSAAVDQHSEIEPTAASIVGGLCLLPLIMCTFYYGLSSENPPDRVFWMVGGMTVLAFLALAGVAYGLSREAEPAENL